MIPLAEYLRTSKYADPMVDPVFDERGRLVNWVFHYGKPPTPEERARRYRAAQEVAKRDAEERDA